VTDAFYQPKAAVPSRPHPATRSSCCICACPETQRCHQASPWLELGDGCSVSRECWERDQSSPRSRTNGFPPASRGHVEVCARLCERVLVLGLRGRGYESLSRVYGVFSAAMSRLSPCKGKSRTELFPAVHSTFPSLSPHETATSVYLQVYFIFSLR